MNNKHSCCVSTSISEPICADGSPENPWHLTFGHGRLDKYGHWEFGCQKCARSHEKRDGVPYNTYFPKTPKKLCGRDLWGG